MNIVKAKLKFEYVLSNKIVGKQGWTCRICNEVNKRKNKICVKCFNTKHGGFK